MSRHESLINRAVGVALTSECRWRHGSVIAKGSRVIAYAPNSRRNNPDIDHENATYHAEEAALRALHRVTGIAYGQGTFKGHTLYVARVNIKSDPVMSRPCKGCWDLLVYSGITEVYFTNELGCLSRETVL